MTNTKPDTTTPGNGKQTATVAARAATKDESNLDLRRQLTDLSEAILAAKCSVAVSLANIRRSEAADALAIECYALEGAVNQLDHLADQVEKIEDLAGA